MVRSVEPTTRKPNPFWISEDGGISGDILIARYNVSVISSLWDKNLEFLIGFFLM